MDKNTNISLHLAKVMGLEPIPSPQLKRVIIDGGVTFDPFASRAQWADVVLWAAFHGYDVALHTDTSYCMTPYKVSECSFEWPGSNEQDHIASTLEAIALATGWTA